MYPGGIVVSRPWMGWSGLGWVGGCGNCVLLTYLVVSTLYTHINHLYPFVVSHNQRMHGWDGVVDPVDPVDPGEKDTTIVQVHCVHIQKRSITDKTPACRTKRPNRVERARERPSIRSSVRGFGFRDDRHRRPTVRADRFRSFSSHLTHLTVGSRTTDDAVDVKPNGR